MIDIIKKGEIISITGAGGKTSLIFFLAKNLSKKGRVLITTTTKIYIPEKQYFEKLYIGNSVVMGDSKNIVVEGRGTLENKLLGLTYDEIEDKKKLYDYILIEADGSKRKLLKGWNDSEPCIPNFTTLTIGVVNLKSIGLTINKENIHRLKIFQKNTSEAVGKLITSDILIKYIETGSFFQKINSKNIIFLNGVESLEDLKVGLEINQKINGKPNIYIGSIRDQWIKKIKSVDAVVMASGFSKRFGSNKLLETLNGIFIIEYLFKTLNTIPFNSIIIVGRDNRLKILAEKYNYKYIENKDASLGQSESLKLGLKNSKADGVMFFPGDQPLLTEKSILDIIKVYEKYDEIIRPLIDKKPSSPVLFPKKYKKQLLKITGDTGGREVIKNSEKIINIEFQDPYEFMDIDSIDDLKQLKNRIHLIK